MSVASDVAGFAVPCAKLNLGMLQYLERSQSVHGFDFACLPLEFLFPTFSTYLLAVFYFRTSRFERPAKPTAVFPGSTTAWFVTSRAKEAAAKKQAIKDKRTAAKQKQEASPRVP